MKLPGTPCFDHDTMPWVLAAHRNVQSYPLNGCNAAHANDVYNREVPLAEYIHAYCIYPCIHTNERHTSTGQCKALLKYETYTVQGYPLTSVLNLALMFTRELFLCVLVLVHTLVLISAYLWYMHTVTYEYSVGLMTYLPHPLSNYVRTGT